MYAILIPLGVAFGIWRSSDTFDNNLSMLFKERLVNFIQGDDRKASLSDMLQGTPFAGNRLCISYFTPPEYPNKTATKDFLKQWFPDKTQEIEDLDLRWGNPSLIIAADTPNGLIVATGNKRIDVKPTRRADGTMTANVYIIAAKYGDNEPNLKTINHCFDFESATLSRQNIKTRFTSERLVDINYVIISGAGIGTTKK